MEALLSVAGPQRKSVSITLASWCLSGNLAILWSHQTAWPLGPWEAKGQAAQVHLRGSFILDQIPSLYHQGSSSTPCPEPFLPPPTTHARPQVLELSHFALVSPIPVFANYRVSTLTQFALSPREFGNGSTAIGQSWGTPLLPAPLARIAGAVECLSQRSSPDSEAGKGCLCQTNLYFRGKLLPNFFHF